MFAIYKRELKSYFHSFIGFLFIAVTLFFLGLYFMVYNLMNGYPYFSYVVSSVAFIFLVSVPILTMKVFADERKNKTDQLILTAPISVWKIVLGKYLSVLTIFTIPVAIICTYPLIMQAFGSVPLGESYLAILGYYLFGAAALAIGVFVSSLTESQVIAAVISFGLLFLGYMMTSISSLISSADWLVKILNCFDLYSHFAEMLNGALNLKGVVYYISLIALVLFFTVQSIQKRRYSTSVKHFSASAYSTGSIAVAVAIAVVLNIVMGELPASITAVDVTSEQLYSLTDQTKEFLKTVDEDITIYVLTTKENQDSILAQTLERYEGSSKHIKLEYVDPTVNPMFASKYTDGTVTTNSLIVESSKRSKVINYATIYATEYDYNTQSLSTSGYDGEGQITSALDYVLADDMPKIYLLQGHGETDLSSTFINALKKENVDYEKINLINYDEVPLDAACVFINAATSDISSDDADKLINYLDNNGSIILVNAWTGEDMPNIATVLDYMGMHVEEGVVVEGDSSRFYRSQYYLLPNVEDCSYTTGIGDSLYVFAPFGQGIVINDRNAEQMKYVPILTTSDQSYSKLNVSTIDNADKEEGDIDGPFNLAVAATKTNDEGEKATLVVYSSAQIFTDSCNQMVSGTNLTLFNNTISGFANHEVSVSIPVKSYEVSSLTVPRSKSVWIGIMTTIIMPVAMLVIGFVIWFKRRKR